MYGFGAGLLYFKRTDVANATPRRVGVLQDIQVDLSGEVKELFGQDQFAVDVGRGKVKIDCKSKLGQISGLIFNEAFFGATTTAVMTSIVTPENHSVPSTSPFHFTVTNTTGFADLGVRYHATQIPLEYVSGTPTTGEYSVTSGGVYTFATGDQGVSMDVDYSYTTSSGGITIPITNQLMGFAPRFLAVCSQIYRGKQWTLTLNRCIAPKLSMPTKIDDYTIMEFDFSAMADDSNTIGSLAVNDLV